MTIQHKTVAELRVPLAVAGAVVTAALAAAGSIYAYGELSNQVHQLAADMSVVKSQLASDQRDSVVGRTSAAERLARVETEVRMTREDVAEIKELLRERNQ